MNIATINVKVFLNNFKNTLKTRYLKLQLSFGMLNLQQLQRKFLFIIFVLEVVWTYYLLNSLNLERFNNLDLL